jgi:hypothetical protein
MLCVDVQTRPPKLPKITIYPDCVRVCILFNLAAVDFEAYLQSKKIDAVAFSAAEGEVWSMWKDEFEQMHPKSFTAQKLYLINPIRRKYPLAVVAEKPSEEKPAVVEKSPETATGTPSPPKPKPAVPRPVFKTKPKTN